MEVSSFKRGFFVPYDGDFLLFYVVMSRQTRPNIVFANLQISTIGRKFLYRKIIYLGTVCINVLYKKNLVNLKRKIAIC